MTQRLFVYGTFGPGRQNEHVLRAIGGTWEEASVNGYLKPQGWGAEMGYPGIVLDDTGDEVNYPAASCGAFKNFRPTVLAEYFWHSFGSVCIVL